jgi:hypothetical protein
MHKRMRILTWCGGALLLTAVAGWLYVRHAVRAVPSFYQQVLAAPTAQQVEASEDLLAAASTLANDVRRQGSWHALFTAEQINGWLAVDLPENHQHLLPPGVSQPRVQLRAGSATIYCWYRDKVETVVSIDLELYVHEPNVLAIRLQTVRAGAVRIPMGNVIEGVSQAAHDARWNLRWLQTEGDPVALLTLPASVDDEQVHYSLTTIELREGELYLAGTTSYVGKPRQPVVFKESLSRLRFQR